MAAETRNYCTGGATFAIGSDIGAIKSPDGVTITHTMELFEPNEAENLNIAPSAWIIGETFKCAATLLEPSRTNIPLVLGSDNSWAGAGPWTIDIGDNQSAPVYKALTVTGYGSETNVQYDRTYNIYRAVVSSPPEQKISKSQLTELAVEFDMLFDDATENTVYQISDAVIP